MNNQTKLKLEENNCFDLEEYFASEAYEKEVREEFDSLIKEYDLSSEMWQLTWNDPDWYEASKVAKQCKERAVKTVMNNNTFKCEECGERLLNIDKSEFDICKECAGE